MTTMQNEQQITKEQTQELTSVWKGSEKTYDLVAQEIEARWGAEAAAEYDPLENCFTFNRWKQEGYSVKKGEKAIKSITYITREVIDETTKEKVMRKFPRTVCLFYKTQVEKISK